MSQKSKIERWEFIDKHRMRKGRFRSDPSDGFNGLFTFIKGSRQLRCIASDGEGWQHVSISIAGSDSTPSWAEMCWIKDLFWDAEEWVCQFHPAHSKYVNNHPGCLHLWRPNDGREIPKPDSLLVGLRDGELSKTL